MVFPGPQLWVFNSVFLRFAKENDTECFLISLLGMLQSSVALVEKDWGLFKKVFLGLEGETTGELAKTEPSELSREQLEDVLGRESLDNCEGKIASRFSSASNPSCFCWTGKLSSLLVSFCFLILPSRQFWKDRSGSEYLLSIVLTSFLKFVSEGAEMHVGYLLLTLVLLPLGCSV